MFVHFVSSIKKACKNKFVPYSYAMLPIPKQNMIRHSIDYDLYIYIYIYKHSFKKIHLFTVHDNYQSKNEIRKTSFCGMVISVQANHIHPFNQSDRSRNVTHVAQPSFIRIRTNIHTKYLLLIFGSACGYFSFWYGSRVHLQEWSLENYISQSNSLLQQGNTINKCPGLQQHNQELQKKQFLRT